MFRRYFLTPLLAGIIAVSSQIAAAETKARGPVTNLPMPRYVSLKAGEGNVRRGPSLSHRIDWVFKRRSMPMQIVGEYGHWRQVRDRDGATGWVHYSLLSGVRTVIIEKDLLALHAKPDTTSAINAYSEIGVVAKLGDCGPDWCQISASGQKGWVPKGALWGVEESEIRD